MSKKLVRYDAQRANLPSLTEAQEDELAVLATKPDSAIDYSDRLLGRGIIQERHVGTVLQTDQDLDHGSDRFQCAGVAVQLVAYRRWPPGF